jgi:hypothetical protein
MVLNRYLTFLVWSSLCMHGLCLHLFNQAQIIKTKQNIMPVLNMHRLWFFLSLFPEQCSKMAIYAMLGIIYNLEATWKFSWLYAYVLPKGFEHLLQILVWDGTILCGFPRTIVLTPSGSFKCLLGQGMTYVTLLVFAIASNAKVRT